MTKPFDIFSPELKTQLFKNSNTRKRTHHSQSVIYPICQLRGLIEAIKTEKDPIKTIRYLVDCSRNLWFAKEGRPSKTTPEHFKMTGESDKAARCLAAGNIEFSADYNRIIMVNHKSGDFSPEFESIQWLLAILIANEPCLEKLSIQLDENLRIEHLTHTGGFQNLYVVSSADLKLWFANTIPIAAIGLTNQPTETKEVTYEPTSSFEQPLRLFDDQKKSSRQRLFAVDHETDDVCEDSIGMALK